MTGDDVPVQHYTLSEQVDLRAALEQAAIEYLDVDDHRSIVIYGSAILMVTATEGQASAVRAFDVALWEPPADGLDRDSDELLSAFVAELVAAADTTYLGE